MRKEIALIDCNNFFVECEIIKNPSLKGKAVCVLSNNDGCVISRSNEAKILGVKMCAPHFIAKREFPQVIYLSSNISFYHDIALRLRAMLNDYSPQVEVYSIDEAFLDLTGVDRVFNTSYEKLIEKIRDDIKEKIGISVSIGLANSKTLAKIATSKAKKGDYCHRIHFEKIEEELKTLPVENIWGVGPNISRTLKRYGIFKASDISKFDDNFYKNIMGKKGLELRHELMGESVIRVLEDEKPKSIQKTSSFPEFSSDEIYIKKTLYKHLHNVCSKLRRLNLTASTLYVMLRTKDFKMYVEEEFLIRPCNSEYNLNKVLEELFSKIFIKGIIYRSSGIYVSGLKDISVKQLDLFISKNEIRSDKIGYILDKLENKYGRGILSLGC